MSLTPPPFDQLAQTVETEWAKAGHAAKAFTSIARLALDNFRYELSLAELGAGLADWFASETKRIPEQINLHNTFGEPPITVFNNGRFVVEIYYWMGCDTSIHSHGFRGAFKVLHGHSLHEQFRPRTVLQFASDVEIAELAEPDIEILSTGVVRTIAPERELVHRVVHLSQPTVSLCVKTIGESGISQWHHFENGLCVQKRHVEPGLIKALYFAELQLNLEPELAPSLVDRLITSQDRSTLLNLCEDVAGGAFNFSDAFTQRLLDGVFERFKDEPWFNLYQAALAESESRIPVNGITGPDRMVGHFINTGRTLTALKRALGLANYRVSNDEIEKIGAALVETVRHESPLPDEDDENSARSELEHRFEAFLKS